MRGIHWLGAGQHGWVKTTEMISAIFHYAPSAVQIGLNFNKEGKQFTAPLLG